MTPEDRRWDLLFRQLTGTLTQTEEQELLYLESKLHKFVFKQLKGSSIVDPSKKDDLYER